MSRKHPSRDAMFYSQKLPGKTLEITTSHDILACLKKALLASRDVMISRQVCSSNLQIGME